MTARKVEPFRLAIVVFKLVTGGAELVVGSALLFLSGSGLRTIIDRLTAAERLQDPGDPVVSFVYDHLHSLLSDKATVGAALLVLGLVKVIGAIGLLRHKPWAYYLLLAMVVLLVPVDTVHLIGHFSLGAAFLAVANVVVLGLLIRYRAPLLAREEGKPR
jgi:uncharacterized membrane protein